MKASTSYILLFACLLYACLPVSSCPASQATASPQAKLPSTDCPAKITEASGQVFKASFIDWSKESFGEAVPAKAGETLLEGMQLSAGPDSRAEVCLSDVRARIADNSQLAVAPERKLVYLLAGQLLLQRQAKHKQNDRFYVWTKALQVRIEDATVFVQSQGDICRITSLSGPATVLNRIDGSIIRIMPGVVYETRISRGITRTEVSAPASAEPNPAERTGTRFLEEIVSPESVPVSVFRTARTATSLDIASPDLICHLSLNTSFHTPGEQLLSTKNLSDRRCLPSALQGQTSNKANQRLARSVRIVSTPTALDYQIGPAIGKELALPGDIVNNLSAWGVSEFAAKQSHNKGFLAAKGSPAQPSPGQGNGQADRSPAP